MADVVVYGDVSSPCVRIVPITLSVKGAFYELRAANLWSTEYANPTPTARCRTSSTAASASTRARR
jgi:hypothetical protein